MQNLACSSIKESYLAYLSQHTIAHDSDGECVLTVPVNTLDSRWVDITVKETEDGFFLVHDAGKASDELFLQGVTISEKKSDLLQLIAGRYAVDLEDGRFMVGCKADHLQHSISAIAHCSAMAMTELLRHRPSVEDETVKSEVGRIITDWGQHRFRVVRDLPVSGNTSEHKFDFLVADETHHVAVNVLYPGQSSISRAQRYGYQGLDLAEQYARYKKLAIIANPQAWTQKAKGLVHKMANKTVDFSGSAPTDITESMEELVSEAA